jgi:hypothetical protein
MQRKNGKGVVTVINPVILPGKEGRFVMYVTGKIRYDYAAPGVAPNVEMTEIENIPNPPKVMFIPQQNVAGISYVETEW